jgi:hypothetical protein
VGIDEGVVATDSRFKAATLIQGSREERHTGQLEPSLLRMVLETRRESPRIAGLMRA